MSTAPPLPPFSGSTSLPIDSSLLLLGNEVEAVWVDDGAWHRAIVYSEPTTDTVGVLFPALQTRAVVPLSHVRLKPPRSGFISPLDSLVSSPTSSSRDFDSSISSSRGSSPHLSDLTLIGQKPHKRIFASASRAWSSFSRTRSASPAVSRSKGFSMSSFPRTRSPSPVVGKTAAFSSASSLSSSSPSSLSSSSSCSSSSSSSATYPAAVPSATSSTFTPTTDSTTINTPITDTNIAKTITTETSTSVSPSKPQPKSFPFDPVRESLLVVPPSDTPAVDSDPPSPYSASSWNGGSVNVTSSPNYSQVYECDEKFADAVTDEEDDPKKDLISPLADDVFVSSQTEAAEVTPSIPVVIATAVSTTAETTSLAKNATVTPATIITSALTTAQPLGTPKFAPRKSILITSPTQFLSTSRTVVPLSPVAEARDSDSLPFASSAEVKQPEPIIITSPVLLRKLSPAPVRGPNAAVQKATSPIFEQTSLTQKPNSKVANLIAQLSSKDLLVDSPILKTSSNQSSTTTTTTPTIPTTTTATATSATTTTSTSSSRDPSPASRSGIVLPKSFPLMMNLFQPGSLSTSHKETLSTPLLTSSGSSTISSSTNNNDKSINDNSGSSITISSNITSNDSNVINSNNSYNTSSTNATPQPSEHALQALPNNTNSPATQQPVISSTLLLYPTGRSRAQTTSVSQKQSQSDSQILSENKAENFSSVQSLSPTPVVLLEPSLLTSFAGTSSAFSSSSAHTELVEPLQPSFLASSSETQPGSSASTLHEDLNSISPTFGADTFPSVGLPEIPEFVDMTAASPSTLRPRTMTTVVANVGSPLTIISNDVFPSPEVSSSSATARIRAETTVLPSPIVVPEVSSSSAATRTRAETTMGRPRGPTMLTPSISTHLSASPLSINTASASPNFDSPSVSTPRRRSTTVKTPNSLSPNPTMRAKWKDLFSVSPTSEKQAKKASLWKLLKPSPKSPIQHAISSPLIITPLSTSPHVSTTSTYVSSYVSVNPFKSLPDHPEEFSLPASHPASLDMASDPLLSSFASSSVLASTLPASCSSSSSSSSSACPVSFSSSSSSSASSASPCLSSSSSASIPTNVSHVTPTLLGSNSSATPFSSTLGSQSRLRSPTSPPSVSPGTRTPKVLFRSSGKSTPSTTPSPNLPNNRPTQSYRQSASPQHGLQQQATLRVTESKRSISPSKPIQESLTVSPLISPTNHELSLNPILRRTVSLSPQPRSISQKQTHLTRSVSLEHPSPSSQRQTTAFSPQLRDALDFGDKRQGSESEEDDFKHLSRTSLQSPMHRGRSPAARTGQTTPLNRQQQRQQQQQRHQQQQQISNSLSPNSLQQQTHRRASPQMRPSQRQQATLVRRTSPLAEQAVGPPSRGTSPGMQNPRTRPLQRSEANIQSPSLRPISTRGDIAMSAQSSMPQAEYEVEEMSSSTPIESDQFIPTRSRATAVVQAVSSRSPGRPKNIDASFSRHSSVGSLSNFVLPPQQQSQTRDNIQTPSRTSQQNTSALNIPRSRSVQASSPSSQRRPMNLNTPNQATLQSSPRPQSFKKPVFASSARKSVLKDLSVVEPQLSVQVEHSPLTSHALPEPMICPDPSAHIHLDTHSPQKPIDSSFATPNQAHLSSHQSSQAQPSSSKHSRISSTNDKTHFQSFGEDYQAYNSEHSSNRVHFSQYSALSLSSSPVIHLHGSSHDRDFSSDGSFSVTTKKTSLLSPSSFDFPEPPEQSASLSAIPSSEELYHRWWMETHLLEGELVGHLFVLPRISPRAEFLPKRQERFDPIIEEF